MRSGCASLASMASALRLFSGDICGRCFAASACMGSLSSCSPSRNDANDTASAIFPHPSGPHSSIACGTRCSATSCSICLLASSCPITSLNFIGIFRLAEQSVRFFCCKLTKKSRLFFSYSEKTVSLFYFKVYFSSKQG